MTDLPKGHASKPARTAFVPAPTLAYAQHMPNFPSPAPASARRASLFRNGRNQAVRIPRDLELPGEEVLIWREGSRLVIEPLARPSLGRLLSSWQPLPETLPEFEDNLPDAVDL